MSLSGRQSRSLPSRGLLIVIASPQGNRVLTHVPIEHDPCPLTVLLRNPFICDGEVRIRGLLQPGVLPSPTFCSLLLLSDLWFPLFPWSLVFLLPFFANILLNKRRKSYFYQLLYTFFAYLRHLQILSRITCQSLPIGPLSPPCVPPPYGGTVPPHAEICTDNPDV